MKSGHYHTLSGGIFLIGLGLLFLLPGLGFWPWILAVIGLAGLPEALAQNKGWMGWQGAFWMIGLALLFATGTLFPGILILIGVSTLMGALTKDAKGSPFAKSTDDPDDPFEPTGDSPTEAVTPGETTRLE